MAESIAFIDDEFVPISEAKISITEPTFTKSDVVYDTLAVWNKYRRSVLLSMFVRQPLEPNLN